MNQEEFLADKATKENNLTTDFAVEILHKEILKKLIDEDIKVIKTDAKANGILIKTVMNALKNLKRAMKSSNGENELVEEDHLYEIFQKNTEIVNAITELQSKSEE